METEDNGQPSDALEISQDDKMVQMVWWDQILELTKIVNLVSIGSGVNRVYLKVFPTGGVQLWSCNDDDQAFARWGSTKDAVKGLKNVLKIFINKAAREAAETAKNAADLEILIRAQLKERNAGDLDE